MDTTLLLPCAAYTTVALLSGDLLLRRSSHVVAQSLFVATM